MIDENFDRRTLANMEVALDRVCAKTPGGDTHEVESASQTPFCNAREAERRRSARSRKQAIVFASPVALRRWRNPRNKSA